MSERPITQDRLDAIRKTPMEKVGLARISRIGAVAQCSCGWQSKPAKRVKVRDDRAERHLKSQHRGVGIWL